MSLRYRAVGAVRETVVAPDPDRLFCMLDSVADHDGEYVVFEAWEEAERFLQVLSVGDRLLDVEWRVSAAGELHRLPALDVLVAHQFVLRCLRDASGWEGTQALDLTAAGAGLEVDYAATGLSIDNAMLDRAKRRRPLGLPAQAPPVVRWNGRDVATGDVWRDLHGDVEILVKARCGRDGWRQGISISTSRPVLSTARWSEQAELHFWPSAAESEFVARAHLAGDEIRVTNVYRRKDEARHRTARWTGNAGFWSVTDSPTSRTYHANFHEIRQDPRTGQ